MKKLLLTTIVISLASVGSAFAKTEGSFLGAYGMLVSSSVKDTSNTDANINEPTNKELRIGFNYQYAINYQGLFISPELFADVLELSNGSTQSTSDKASVKTRYGVKANIGYDVTEKFAPYVTAGISEVEYQSSKYNSTGFTTTKVTGSKTAPIYGLGANFRIHDSAIFNVEYNRQSVDLSQGTGTGLGKYEVDIDTIKFGVAYNF